MDNNPRNLTIPLGNSIQSIIASAISTYIECVKYLTLVHCSVYNDTLKSLYGQKIGHSMGYSLTQYGYYLGHSTFVETGGINETSQASLLVDVVLPGDR